MNSCKNCRFCIRLEICKRSGNKIPDLNSICKNWKKELPAEREDSEGEAMVQRMLDNY